MCVCSSYASFRKLQQRDKENREIRLNKQKHQISKAKTNPQQQSKTNGGQPSGEKNLQPLLQSYEVALTQSPHAFATYKKTGYSCYILSQKAEREVSSAYKRVVKTKSSLQRLIPSISDKAEEVSARNRTAQITSRAILPADLFDPPLCSGFQAARGPNGITWVSKIGFPSRGTISAKYSLLQTKFSRLLA